MIYLFLATKSVLMIHVLNLWTNGYLAHVSTCIPHSNYGFGIIIVIWQMKNFIFIKVNQFDQDDVVNDIEPMLTKIPCELKPYVSQTMWSYI